MTENYKFTSTLEKIEDLKLTENEKNTVLKAGLTPEDFFKLVSGTPMDAGSRALIFEIPAPNSNSIAKVWKDRFRDADKVATEGLVLRLLKMRNFKNAPRLHGHLRKAGVIFEEKIEGKPIKNFDSETIKKLAAALADLHSIELNSYGKPFTKRKKGNRLDYLHDNVNNLLNLCQSFNNNEISVLLQNKLNQLEPYAKSHRKAFESNIFTLIHFDLSPRNILFSRDRGDIILLDWEQASAGDNAMDIAKLFLKANFNSMQVDEFLHHYTNSSANKDEYLLERLPVYNAYVLANSIIWRLHVLNDRPEQVSGEIEKNFYNRVEKGLNIEIEKLKNIML